ncbi:16S rRNA pseudouridine(516) synthase RsuA [Endozoicomonas numazuensis]|uniref:Pseudouridine synthase n=1 Tax=Endozoicomonas numazuensis TaxID=1137799 RepID=A0A081NM28_9GAMM|nr:16S rRNA pseudouridine(516) synthase RsuA [Endozoicomonas numazuensis]KEQ19501.1 16S rRNA pseudouridylate synthase [Endozoicomonas numazuensis]
MRLDKFLCESTELTRSEAKRLLKTGSVSVDGTTIKNPAQKIASDSEVLLDGEKLSLVGFRYLMLNKPADTLCSTLAGTRAEMYPSIIELLDVVKSDRLRIAGRLDVDTTGLVLVTDDGQWSHRITSPGKECGKRYRVELDSPLDKTAVELFAEGIQLKGEKKLTRPAQLEFLSDQEVLLTIHEGRYHQVKRMFAALGNHVVALHREKIGSITLDPSLEAGEWRYLTEDEVNSV